MGCENCKGRAWGGRNSKKREDGQNGKDQMLAQSRGYVKKARRDDGYGMLRGRLHSGCKSEVGVGPRFRETVQFTACGIKVRRRDVGA